MHSFPCAPPHSSRGGCPEGTSDAPQEPGPDNGNAQLLLTGTPPHRMATCPSLGLGVVGRCCPHRWDGPRAPCWQRRRSCPQMSQAAEHPFLLARAGFPQELQVVGGVAANCPGRNLTRNHIFLMSNGTYVDIKVGRSGYPSGQQGSYSISPR